MSRKLLTMVIILAAIVVIASGLTRVATKDSMSLTEYMQLNNSPAPGNSSGNAQDTTPTSGNPSDNTQSTSPASGSSSGNVQNTTPAPETPAPTPSASELPSQLTGASLNGSSQLEQRVDVAEGFYYEPISEKLRRYMTGVSYPAPETDTIPEITFEELRYLHILHYDFDGIPTEGELICNAAIAQDLAEIFYELYRNEYQLEKVLLIDEYDGDDNASMEDNNTSCFNYRPVPGTNNLSKHSYGLAIDINPLYNPYITYTGEGTENIAPVSARPYADRSQSFPYKIDTNDLCYQLFIQHGFTWGGNWNNSKDYQHFQKYPLP